MAQRRMFSLHVVDTDLFLDMPATAQALYFHLSMRADDDGFVSSPRKIMKVCNASDDDYKLLMAKRFVIPFDSGICVIRHWRIHNYIQKDRYSPTMYHAEKAMLEVENGHYEELDTPCIHDVSIMDTQVRLGKVRLGKGRLGEGGTGGEGSRTPEHSEDIELRDSVLSAYREAITELLPATAWPDVPGQWAALKELSTMTRDTQPTTPIETPEDFAKISVATYVAMKRNARSDYWKTASFEPKAIKRRFGDVVTEMAKQHRLDQEDEVGMAALRRMGKI